MRRPAVEFLDVANAAVSGAKVLASCAEKVEFKKLSGDAVEFQQKGQPSELGKAAVLLWACVPVTSAIAWSLDRYGWMNEFQFRNFSRASTPFWFLAASLAFIGTMILLLLKVVGPERDTVVQVEPLRIKIDSWAAGDHIVREYLADTVIIVALLDEAVAIGIPTAEVYIGASMPKEVRAAVVPVIAVGLWQESAYLARNRGVLPKKVLLFAGDLRKLKESIGDAASAARMEE